jgi:hypothetical protein
MAAQWIFLEIAIRRGWCGKSMLEKNSLALRGEDEHGETVGLR